MARKTGRDAVHSPRGICPAALFTDSARQSNRRLKRLIGNICKSSAYQLSARFEGEWKDSYTKYYARKYVRQLSAEEVVPSVFAPGVPLTPMAPTDWA